QVPVDTAATELNSNGTLGEGDLFIWFTSSDTSVTEGNKSIFIYMKRTKEFSQNEQSALLEISGDADSSDYQAIKQDGVAITPVSGVFSVKFKEGKTLAIFEVILQEDVVYEPNEQLIFSILPGISGNIHTKTYSSYHIKILNDDPMPSLSFDSPSSAAMEGMTKNIPLTLSNPSYQDTRALVKNIGGSAGENDHDFEDQYVNIPAGALSANVFVLAENDGFSELDETLKLEVLPSIGLDDPPGNSVHTLTIQEAGTTPSFEFDQATATVNEADGSYTVQMNFTENFDQELHLPFSVSGSATLGKDYKLSKQYFTLPLGSNTATVEIALFDENIFEEDETIVLRVQDQNFGLAGTNSEITITIEDDEAEPTVGFASDTYYSQEGSTVYLPIQLSRPAQDDMEIAFSVDGASSAAAEDYASAYAGSVTINAGASRLNLPIKLNEDEAFEAMETLILKLDSVNFLNYAATPELGIDQTTIHIKETSDQPVISFSADSQNISEGDGSFDVIVELDKASDINLDFSIAVKADEADASDYTAPAKDHTIPAGDTTYIVNIPLIDDSIDEPAESLDFTLLQPTNMNLGERREQMVNIIDNDNPSIATLSASAPTVEEGGQEHFEVVLNKLSGYDISIPATFTGAAIEGEDYTVSASAFVIPAGKTSARIDIDALEDGLYETPVNENIQIKLASGSVYTLSTDSGSMAVVDDQAKPQAFFANSSVAGLEGDLLNVTAWLEHPTFKDVELEISFDDNYNAGTCNAACANIVNEYYDTDINSKLNGAGVLVLKIPAGKSKATFSFRLLDDKRNEADDERFKMVITGVNDTDAASVSPASEMEVTIVDLMPDGPPTPPELSPEGGKIYNTNFSVGFDGSEGSGAITYHYTTDGTAPTCSSSSAPAYDHDVLAAPDSNGDTFTLRVIACDPFGNESGETSGVYTYVAPQAQDYYANAANWNDYVMDKDDPASGACDGASDSSCFHGGKLRKVELSGVETCDDLNMSDNLGVFYWQCKVDTAPDPDQAYFVNTGFKPGFGLKDLIDSDSTDWKDMSFSLSGSIVINDPLVGAMAKPWSNSIELLPVNASALEILASAGTIYIYTSDGVSA
ncbi:MAG: Calx-beta domain-containing protein, partial [Bacteriovoracaceae bacterium]